MEKQLRHDNRSFNVSDGMALRTDLSINYDWYHVYIDVILCT